MSDPRDHVPAATHPVRPELDEAALATIAARAGVDALDLRLRLGLHVPRFGSDVTRDDLIAEALRLAAEALAVAPAHLRERPADASPDVQDTVFCEVDDAEARSVNERLHYLRSHRPNSRHFGLRTPRSGSLAALATVSYSDETQLAHLLPAGIRLDETAMLSRVFAHRWAPRNAISYLLSRVEKASAQAPPAPRVLLTYVNPNLGFTGTSYRAVNWSVLGDDDTTHYSYVDGEYQSDRQLAARFGSADDEALTARLGSRFKRVSEGLEPLLVFAKAVEA